MQGAILHEPVARPPRFRVCAQGYRETRAIENENLSGTLFPGTKDMAERMAGTGKRAPVARDMRGRAGEMQGGGPSPETGIFLRSIAPLLPFA